MQAIQAKVQGKLLPQSLPNIILMHLLVTGGKFPYLTCEDQQQETYKPDSPGGHQRFPTVPSRLKAITC
eukprot:scaffold160976_cov18-Tisochrysis_lutea.AAC.1